MGNRKFVLVLLSLFVGCLLLAAGTGTAIAMMGGGGGGMGGGSGSSGLATFSTSHFAGSGVCADCHSGLTDSQGNDVSIDSDWRSSMMANSSKDPLWQAKMQSETLRHPALKSVIENKCSTCHMPMARTQATFDGTEVKIQGDGFLSSGNGLHAAAMDGISCTLCHQIEDTNLGTRQSFTGGYVIDRYTAKPDRKIYGQYQNPLANPMIMGSSFTPAYGAQSDKSELCATCHTLYTPTVDDSGNVVGELAEQTPYLEWQHSRYGDGAAGDDRSCQSCHMPKADGAVAISNRPMMLAPRDNFYKHYFVGGNAFMMGLLKGNLSALGITATSDQMNTAINRTVSYLQNETAGITVEPVSQSGDTISIPVRITNASGHKFPTGIPARRAWIHLTVTDKRGKIVFESGRVNADGGIVGGDADADGTKFEPHYDVISSPQQVQIYESVMGDVNGAPTYTLLRGANYLKDNRLLPQGFDKAAASYDVKVFGQAESDASFNGGDDTVTYAINLPGYSGKLTAKAELLFESLSYPFYSDLMKDKAAGDLVSRFDSYYAGANKTPVVISQGQVSFTK